MSAVDLTEFVARDTVSRVTPLGVRFWDSAAGRLVTDSLVVRYVWAHGARSRTAVVNNEGVWVLSDLPGLVAVELATEAQLGGAEAGSADYWTRTAPVARTYLIEVRDLLGRFLPISFEAKLPHQGVFQLPPTAAVPGLSPVEAALPSIPLFSQPSRPAPPGAGVIRAELHEPSGSTQPGPPAPWALLEVSAAGAPTVRGLSDDKGRVVVFYPYPGPSATSGSPPSGANRSLASETWDLQVACRYGAYSPPPGNPPDIVAVLDQPTALLELDSSPAGPPPQLAFGRELTLYGPGRSPLVVTPATSPP